MLTAASAYLGLNAQPWVPITSPSSGLLLSCSFVSGDTGWVMQQDYPSGAGDAVYRTTDGGASWTSQVFPPDPAFTGRYFCAVDFVNAEHGIITCNNYYSVNADPALYSTVLWTDDGGANWTYKDLGNNHISDYDGRLVNDSVAYVIGQYGVRKKTTDGGTTWTDLYSVSPYSGMKLFPISEDTVYYVGLENLSLYGAFGMTLNGGGTWPTSVVSLNTAMRAIHFNDHLNGWIGGHGGEILRTDDAGATWIPCTTGVMDVINDLEFTDGSNGWAVTSAGQILRSVDGGQSWQVEHDGTTPLWDLDFVAGGMGYAVGEDGLVLSFQGTAGIQEPPAFSRLDVFPNPCRSIATLNWDRPLVDAEIAIFRMDGSIAARFSGFSGTRCVIDTRSWVPGVYAVGMVGGGSGSFERLVVAHE